MTDILPRELRVKTVPDPVTSEEVLPQELERRNAVRGATDGARRVNGRLVRVLPGLPVDDMGEVVSEAELLERNAQREVLRKRREKVAARAHASANVLLVLTLRDELEARLGALEGRLQALESQNESRRRASDRR